MRNWSRYLAMVRRAGGSPAWREGHPQARYETQGNRARALHAMPKRRQRGSCQHGYSGKGMEKGRQREQVSPSYQHELSAAQCRADPALGV